MECDAKFGEVPTSSLQCPNDDDKFSLPCPSVPCANVNVDDEVVVRDSSREYSDLNTPSRQDVCNNIPNPTLRENESYDIRDTALPHSSKASVVECDKNKTSPSHSINLQLDTTKYASSHLVTTGVAHQQPVSIKDSISAISSNVQNTQITRLVNSGTESTEQLRFDVQCSPRVNSGTESTEQLHFDVQCSPPVNSNKENTKDFQSLHSKVNNSTPQPQDTDNCEFSELQQGDSEFQHNDINVNEEGVSLLSTVENNYPKYEFEGDIQMITGSWTDFQNSSDECFTKGCKCKLGYCAAPNCQNKTTDGIRVFRFPRDKQRRAQWVKYSRRDKWQLTHNSVFRERHYEESQVEQKRTDGRKLLKWNSIPTIFNVPNPPKSWAPDGTCILTNSDDNILRVFDLPRELHCQEKWTLGRTLPEITPALKIRAGGQIYDYCWYPLMSSDDPLSCCLVSTSQYSPVHLWDAYTGAIRCTYRPYNEVDEVEHAYSVAFGPSGEKLYCGFKNKVRVFDTCLPGRECTARSLKGCGRVICIISTICVNPVLQKLYVVGSYSKTIALCSEPDGKVLCLFCGQGGGVTHLAFSPDGSKLYAGCRKDSEILCWDLRNLGTVLYAMEREVENHQRIYFHTSADGQYLMSGGTNGKVTVWDLQQPPVSSSTNHPILPALNRFQASHDSVSGVSLHHQYPILATSSGQRHFGEVSDNSDDDDAASPLLKKRKHLQRENGLKLWWLGQTSGPLSEP